MSESEFKSGNAVQDAAELLADQLRGQGGSKELRRRARALLKQAYLLEQECGEAEKISDEQKDRVLRLASEIDEVYGTLVYEDASKLTDQVLERYATPSINIGQRIRAERAALVAIEADRLSARFLNRIDWFWERSVRAQTGVAGIGSAKEEPSTEKKPAERESFELIWRRRRK